MGRAPLKSLSEVIVSFFDLVEAEGRALRRSVLGICFAVVLFLIAGAFLVVAVLLAIAGLHVVISNVWGTVRACFATAAIAAAASYICLLIGLRIAAGNGAPKEQKEVTDDDNDEGHGNDGDRGGQEPPAPSDGEREP
jgi:hypothetical protein